MLFTTPIWLIGLLPWAVLAALLLLSRRPRTNVPFLDLWRINAPKESIRRSFSPPPIGVILALLATLLAIVAAAGPAVRRPGADAVTVIIDTGGSMSMTEGGQTRFARTADRLAKRLKDDGFGNVPLQLIAVPGAVGSGSFSTDRTTAEALASAVAALPPSALDTRAALRRAIRQSLVDPAVRTLVIADQPIDVGDRELEGDGDRVLRVAPASPPAANVGIRSLAVRQAPAPQAMVRIEWSGGTTPLTLRITTAGQSVLQPVDVATGQSRDVFVPLPAVGGVVTAELLDAGGAPIADAFSADDRADLVAESHWPAIQPAVAVGELQRLIDIYTAGRPGGERSIAVRLVMSIGQLGESAGIVLPALGGAAGPTRVTRAADHAAVADIDLSAVTLPAAADRALPPGQWQPVLFDDAGPLLAVRELPSPSGDAVVRQAWCAIDPRGWADGVPYVVFWSALFDWIGDPDGRAEGAADGGAGADRMAAWPLESLTADWTPVERSPGGDDAVYWPGVYQRQGDSRRRAFGPAEVSASPGDETTAADAAALSDREQGRRLLRQGERRAPLSPWLLLGSIALAGAAAAVWRRRAGPSALRG